MEERYVQVLLTKYQVKILENLKRLFFLARFNADEYNKLKNMVSKVIGEKMKVCILFYFFTTFLGFMLLVGEGFLSISSALSEK